ncbi:MAG: zinc ABC transporter substrate-binding protein [Simkaniaceae bacterium]|nr:zinc ABC transporter substrate-binding protein [Simkaniaceae bacterium]
MRKLLLFVFCLSSLFFFIGCQKKETLKSSSVILVSVAPYYPIVSELAQGVATVEVVVPKDSNVHFYEPTPSDINKLANAAIWFGTGDVFEKKMLPALEARSPLNYVDLSKSVELIPSSDNLCHSHHHDGHSHDHSGYPDLHIWMSPVLMKEQVNAMLSYLILWKPEEAERFQENAAVVCKDLDELNHKIQTILAPYQGDAVLLSHPALGYFCQTYGLEQLSIECEGKTPSPRDMERLLKHLDHTQIRCAFSQPQFDNRALVKIANDLSIPTYSMDPYAIDYYKNLFTIASEIAQ